MQMIKMKKKNLALNRSYAEGEEEEKLIEKSETEKVNKQRGRVRERTRERKSFIILKS